MRIRRKAHPISNSEWVRLLRFSHGPLLDDPAMAALDEGGKNLYVLAFEFFDLLQSLRGVQLGRQQQPRKCVIG